MNIKTILSKPIPVIWYRFMQLIKLKIYLKVSFWKKIEQRISKIENSWNVKSDFFSKNFLPNDIPESLKNGVIKNANEIINGSISVFDVNYEFKRPIHWNEDWRANKTWENKYFKLYSFYEKDKLNEYDVKFPWELSRLSFLIQVARAYQLEEKESQLLYIYSILKDWKIKNPIAYSVNWYPMEVSVRAINLIALREVLLEAQNTDETIKLLNQILLLHGIFLWRNVEYTDVRGNHYSANLTALLLLGKTFKGFYPEAKTWYNYAVKKTEKEFHLQFINDGVNFEKSIPYHRLVVEFYLISFLVLQRSGVDITPKTLSLLKKACEFSRDCTKPNKLIPIIGDNDSASVFQNDDVLLNNHSNMLQLASLFFNDEKLNIEAKKYFSAFEVFGNKKVESIKSVNQNIIDTYYYNEGGFVCVKNADSYFITDVGEVGMKGRGGHGHNDLFSFELMHNQTDIIVDAGCYTYTGDLALKTKMKSTSCHNGLVVDGKEIAPMIGNWGISDIAKPSDIYVNNNDLDVIVSGKHLGYSRLPDPVTHQRKFKIQKKNFKLNCTDVLSCKSFHKINRTLHFSEKITLKIAGNIILASNEENTYQIKFDEVTICVIDDYTLSYNYGSKMNSKKVTLQSEIKGNTELFFTIEKIK